MNCCQEINSPLVSVIIPAYNAERFIAKTLESVINQTYKNIEVLVVDDGSSDRTAEIVIQIVHVDSRVRLLYQPNSGVAAARNLAIQHAKGEFIAPIDADDIWHPSNIEKQLNCMLQLGLQVGVVYAWSLDIDEKNLPTGKYRASLIQGKVNKTLICHYFLGNGSCSLIRRSCLEKIGKYNADLKGCEDWDLYLRISEYYEFRVIPEFLVGYRKTLNSLSFNFEIMLASHSLMLENLHRNQAIQPGFLGQISKSYFYLYLAQRSSQKGEYDNSIKSLRLALRVGLIISLLSLSFYSTLIQILLDLTTKSIRCQSLVASGLQKKSLFFIQPKNQKEFMFCDIKLNLPGKQAKILIEEIFHSIIQGNKFKIFEFRSP